MKVLSIIQQLIQETEDVLQDLKNRKGQRKHDADGKTTEVEEIRKELGKINKVKSELLTIVLQVEYRCSLLSEK